MKHISQESMLQMANKYSWKRFWVPPTGRLNLDDGGYLLDPDSKWGDINNPDVVPFQAIESKPVLALLGEPGMGKSHTLQEAYESAKLVGPSLFIDLHSIGSEYSLDRKLFQRQEFLSWSQGKHPLHLFLDSLDERLLNISHLGSLLVEELKRCSFIENLYLRIACRTAVWPGILQDQDLMGGEEQGNGLALQVGEDALRETLNDTALFSSRGPHRMGFAHRSYAEFLAAWYFVKHDVKTERLLGLLRHPEDLEGKIVPQLQGVAAWLAGMNNDVFNTLCKSQPDVLLGADEAGLSLDQREMLVDALLHACERGDWVDSDWGATASVPEVGPPQITRSVASLSSRPEQRGDHTACDHRHRRGL
jgi:hypothetical protein